MNRPLMDILLVARSVDVTRHFGDAVHVRELASAFVREGHSLRLLALGADSQEHPTGLGQELAYQLPMELQVTTGICRLYHPRQAAATAKVLGMIRRARPHVVYARPSVGITGAFDILPEFLASRLARIPIVLEINGWAEDDASLLRGSRLLRLHGLGKGLASRLFARVDGFVVVNASLGKRLEKEYRVPSQLVRVVSNAANPELFAPTDASSARLGLGLPVDGPIIVFVGHVGLEADLGPVIESMVLISDEFPNATLLVVGGGSDMPSYRALARRCGVDSRVAFVGVVPHEQVPFYINAADVALVPIKPHLHSTPMKLFEYWSCARAVVASDQPDHQLVEEVGGGILAVGNSSEGWAESISSLLRDPSRRREMGQRGRGFVLRERTWTVVADQIAEFLGEVVARGNETAIRNQGN